MNTIIKYNKRIFRIITLLFGVIIFAGLFSCEDYLNQPPLDKISDEAVWDDITLMNAFVMETYKSMYSPTNRHFYASVCSDESFARERTGAHLIQAGNISPSDLGYMSSQWPNLYDIIAKSNIFLSNVTSNNYSDFSEGDKEKLELLIAEMRWHRAWSYYKLATLFGGVPLVTEPFSLDDSFDIPRDSYDDVMNYVIAELDEVANVLPLEQPSDDYGRVTKGAALATKARVLLYMASPLNNPGDEKSKWQATADAAMDVIDLNLYSLYPDYGELFREEANYNNQEYILERVINNTLEPTVGIEREMYPNGHGGWACVVPSQRQVEAYNMKSGLLIEDDPSYEFTKFWENRDPRFYETILYDGAQFRGREIETWMPNGLDSFGSSSGPWNSSYTGYYTRKYVNEFLPGAPGGGSGNTSSPNMPLIRYAEILLIYAEAQYHLGNEDITREYINKVRSRPSVDMPDVTESGPALMKRLKNERQVELYLEGHRFYDIRRWKEVYPEDDYIRKMSIVKDQETGEKTYELTNVTEWALPEHTYVLPIPLEEMTRDPSLEPNNPGY